MDDHLPFAKCPTRQVKTSTKQLSARLLKLRDARVAVSGIGSRGLLDDVLNAS
jgi:hypothetical protein